MAVTVLGNGTSTSDVTGIRVINKDIISNYFTLGNDGNIVYNSTILGFLTSVKEVYVDYMYKLANKERLGAKELSCYRDKGFLLTSFVDIFDHYFNLANSTDTNFFTVSEIHDILQHFNLVAGTDIYIDFDS